jgi:hypothetical protein
MLPKNTDRRGVIRIIEASIAILIILGVLLFVNTRNSNNGEVDLSPEIGSLLEMVAQDKNLREDVLNGQTSGLEQFLNDNLRASLEFRIKICEIDEICSLDSYPPNKQVFAEERIISTNLQKVDFSPKKVKIFVWEK